MQVPLSIGVQTGGSIIRPAAYTGVFAMKPTWNAISPQGTKTFSPTFDTLGFFARSIEDLQLVADVFVIQDDEPPNDISLKDTSVALIKTPMWPKAGPSTEAAMKKAADIFQENGVRVEEVLLPPKIGNSEDIEQMQRMIMKREAQGAFLREYRVDKTKISPSICRIVENSSNFTHKEQTHAEDTLASLRSIIDKLASNYSAILTPSAMDEAPLGLDDMGSPVFNTLWTASVSILLVVRWPLTCCRVSMDPSLTYLHLPELMGCFEEDWPGLRIIKRLVDIPCGLFIWASTACRYIRDGRRLAMKRITKLLNQHIDDAGPERQLDQIYTTVLRDCIQQGYSEEEKTEIYEILREVLGSIVVLFSPLSMDSLAALCGIPLSNIKETLADLHTIFNICSQVSGPIRLHHPTFRDFLIDKERCRDLNFWVDEKQTHKALADSCLALMENMLKRDICGLGSPGILLDDIDPNRIQQCIPPELQYACLY
jgi:hypothetical protein